MEKYQGDIIIGVLFAMLGELCLGRGTATGNLLLIGNDVCALLFLTVGLMRFLRMKGAAEMLISFCGYAQCG